MQAKRIIPATIMGLGALTAYLLYANSQREPVDTIAASVQEIPHEQKKKQAKAEKKSAPVKVASLKQSKPVEKTVEKEPTPAPKVTIDSKADLASALKPVLSKTFSDADIKAFKTAYAHMRKDRYT